MTLRQNDKGSQLFTLRIWPENLGEGRMEWRGKIQHVVGGETLYFRDWDAMLVFLLQTFKMGIPTTGEEAFVGAWQEGRAMSTEQAVRYALDGSQVS